MQAGQDDSRDADMDETPPGQADSRAELERLLREALEERDRCVRLVWVTGSGVGGGVAGWLTVPGRPALGFRYKEVAENAQNEVQSTRGENLFLRGRVDEEQRRVAALRREHEARASEIRSTQSDAHARLQQENQSLQSTIRFRDREQLELEAKLRELQREKAQAQAQAPAAAQAAGPQATPAPIIAPAPESVHRRAETPFVVRRYGAGEGLIAAAVIIGQWPR
jgi:DNA repair exonuclease SbcCD ATPase subunit